MFVINLPLSAAGIAIALRHVPETRDEGAARRVDVPGALSLTLALAGAVYALIEAPASGFSGLPAAGRRAGRRGRRRLLRRRAAQHASRWCRSRVFGSRQFSGANLVTLFVYAAMGATTFLLVVHLQEDLGYSALEAGASLLPITALMLAFSARSAGLAQRIGPRLPMTVGPLLIAAGLVLMGRISPGDAYVTSVLPAVLVVGCGLVFTVAPLTATVLAAIDVQRAGIGSAINNAVARIGALLAVAVLPAAAGITTLADDLGPQFATAMHLTAALATLGAAIAFLTIATHSVPVSRSPCRSIP